MTFDQNVRHGVFKKIQSAFFYGFCSFLMVFINKYILTVLKFPSFVVFGVLQMIFAVLLLFIASRLSIIKLPRYNSSIPRKIFPLPLLFFVSLVAGLGGTQKISLPLFTALRHTTIFITMIIEYVILRIVPSRGVKLSVGFIIFGSLLAAIYDLAFDATGYALIFANNFAGALNGVSLKKKLNTREFSPNSLLFYNSLFMIPIGLIIAFVFDDFPKVLIYFQTSDILPLILVTMSLTFFFGILLNYSILRCTEHNSALTTTFVGASKNTAITYIGMLVSGDYVFHLFPTLLEFQ